VEEIAKKKNVSMSQIALAWLMAKDPVAAPIVGTTKMENLMDVISVYRCLLHILVLISLAESVEVKLDDDEIKYLEELYTSKPIVGH
jgi:aryl-alcohol dehydrogenase-like predicted oxidoreductase